ncbi:Crp/Fnr family transcriptional regulator [Agriterribacter sp.]|uniref:Crp/Fnr family transcriptional regulator n=1 Tax=Agriterribacter sp. TaxID=2821509 RepID=UPI002BA24802|nr:Crp/Fnr family transcriptional regulator [Agriterribacter sp.]HTN05346.1 Crp/Fnr family transcriptional regulator [Agriterribacter sp.]
MAQPNPRCNTCRVRNCSVLSNCSNNILEALSDNKEYLHFQRRERLLIEGQHGGGIYFIRSGIAKIEVNGKSGRPLILRLAGAGSVFGHRIRGSNNEQPLSVEAVEDLYVCHISLAYYDQLVEKSPALHSGMMQSLLNEIRQVELHAVRLTHLSVKERVAGTLLHIAALYQYQPGSNGIRVHLERQDLADLSGTTREQVSRMLSGLQQGGYIKYRGKHFKFFNLPGLQQIAALY